MTITPDNFSSILDTIDNLVTDAKTQVRILKDIVGLGGYNATTQSIDATSDAVSAAVVRRLALVRIGVVSTQVAFTSRQDGLSFLASMSPLFDAEIEYSSSSNEIDVFMYFDNLLSSIENDVRQRCTGLPELLTLELKKATCPCALAQKLYGDGSRDEEIIIRNDPVNPFFIEATDIEILSR
ncbi:hypothetical protein HK22_02120 [Gluconobacter sp. DsW_056]|uniref:hypothetical protein n=1 Tax=Gluconobacter sp. DsW_056 TaxID=1511209 RepID=UPI000A39DF03|nr:hypothetical protein [Gluconobacter sp. DsW_056]OUI81675.1 hypothetical protein HK22_02120 [Gluconobacter sp. DsW_056]